MSDLAWSVTLIALSWISLAWIIAGATEKLHVEQADLEAEVKALREEVDRLTRLSVPDTYSLPRKETDEDHA